MDTAITLWRVSVIVFWHVLIAIPSVLLVALLPNGGVIGARLFARFWGRVTLFMCGVPWVIEGLERIDPRKPWVFVINHASEFDFYALSAALPLQWRALMRPALRRIPAYGWTAERTGHVFVRMGDPDTTSRSYAQALRQLRLGHSLLVFAEGRRSFDGKLRPLKRGAFVIAIESQVPVVPVAVEERLSAPRRLVFGRGFSHRIRELRVTFGEPIATRGLEPEDLDALRERTIRAIAEAHVEPPEIVEAEPEALGVTSPTVVPRRS